MEHNRCGIICVDKPQGFTSFDVVAKMRGILKTRKVGHAGTLDPMATGVLPLFLGRATKCCDILPCEEKRYTAQFQLGIVTDTQDITGTVLSQNSFDITLSQVQETLSSFVGEIQQLPPMYSAIQIGGQRLYDLARQGIEVERTPRTITVFSLDLLEADVSKGIYTIDVRCSKGSYIRTLVHDIGTQLGCGATMTALRRTESSGFSLQQCITIEQAQEICDDDAALAAYILPVDRAFDCLEKLVVSDKQGRLFQCGVKLELGRVQLPLETAAEVRVYNQSGDFLGIAYPDRETNLLRMKKLFATEVKKVD